MHQPGLAGDGNVGGGVGTVVIVEHHTGNDLPIAHNAEGVEAAPFTGLANLLGDPCTDGFFLVEYECVHG